MPRLLYLAQMWEKWGVPGGNINNLPAERFYAMQWLIRTRDVLIAEKQAMATENGYERLGEDTRRFLAWLKKNA